MTEKSKLLRTLQRIATTARRFDPNTRPTPPIQATPNILTSLPEHKPLLPLLLSHDIPLKLARACADRYDGYASQLKSETESKLSPYLVGRGGSQPAKIYSLFLNTYNQTLQRWSQSILNTALKELKRNSVELRDCMVTYPAPLWMPMPPNPAFAHGRLEKNCPLSPMTRPAHAFPITYPPPLRPPSGFFPIEWFRTPEASPTPPSASTIDLDSLCNQFATSLVIDENSRQPRQRKPSIFSLPVVGIESTLGHSRPQSSKRKHSRDNASQKPSTTGSSISPLKTTKPRQLSVPPSFTLLSTMAKPTRRKASAPVRVSSSRHAPGSLQLSTLTCHTALTMPTSLNTSTVSDRDIYSHPGPSTPLNPRPPLESTLNRTTHTPHDFLRSPIGPTTPPALLPDLFSEPTVVPSTPVCLSPGSSLMPITDPFLQFQPQHGYFSDPLVSTFDYSGSTHGLTAGGFFSKSSFDTPLGFDHLFHGTIEPLTPNPFENNFFTTYAMP